jgi:hypothetical protein
MRIIISSILLFLVPDLLAQKEGNNWVMGLGNETSADSTSKVNLITFNDGTFQANNLYLNIRFFGAASTVSDTSGALMCYSNGLNIYNFEHETIVDGDSLQSGSSGYFPFGYPFNQSILLIRVPDTINLYYAIYNNNKDIGTTIIATGIYYSLINMADNGGLGQVIDKKKLIPSSSDTLNLGYLYPIRHGNGKDWWLIVTKFNSNIHRKFLITKNGILFHDDQPIGPLVQNGDGFGRFSSDGKWFSRYMAYGQTSDPKSVLYLYKFDRCTGQLSSPIKKDFEINDVVYGGVAFSPNSQLLYLSRMTKLFQYDLNVTDILGSEQIVAEYDGFTDDHGRPTRFYGLANAPDGKIYCSVSNVNTRYFHVIDQPNQPGMACNFLQHAILLPAQVFGTVQNIPDYSLGAREIPCDSMVSTVTQQHDNTLDQEIKVWPVPASDYLCFSSNYPSQELLTLRIFNSAGLEVLMHQRIKLDPIYTTYLDHLASGIYFYVLSDEWGKDLAKGKVIRTRQN